MDRFKCDLLDTLRGENLRGALSPELAGTMGLLERERAKELSGPRKFALDLRVTAHTCWLYVEAANAKEAIERGENLPEKELRAKLSDSELDVEVAFLGDPAYGAEEDPWEIEAGKQFEDPQEYSRRELADLADALERGAAVNLGRAACDLRGCPALAPGATGAAAELLRGLYRDAQAWPAGTEASYAPSAGLLDVLRRVAGGETIQSE